MASWRDFDICRAVAGLSRPMVPKTEAALLSSNNARELLF
jgi:hypothetical protein